MRLAIRVVLVLALLWCGWWAVASFALHRGLSQAIATRDPDGWRAEVRQEGFPFRIAARLDDVTLADPDNMLAWRMDGITLSAPTYWPGFATLRLGERPVTLQTPEADFDLVAPDAVVSVTLSPGTALTLRRVRAQADSLAVRAGGAEVIRADGLDASVRQDAEHPARYDFEVVLPRLTPAATLRELMGVTPERPASFDAFEARGSVAFDAALDRHALRTAPQPRKLTLETLEIVWGDISLVGEGAVDIDADGLPTGAIEIEVRNWRKAIDLATAAGLLTGAARLRTELTLGALANFDGNPDNLDLTLKLADGRATLGQLDLGQAPRIYLQ